MRTPPTAFKANTPGLHSHSNLLEAKLRSASPKSQKLNPLERKISASTSKMFTMEKEAKFVTAEVSALSRPTAREAAVGNNQGKSSESLDKSEEKSESDVREPSENKPKVEMGEMEILDMISTARRDGDNFNIEAMRHAEDINSTTNSDDESEIFVDASMILNDGENENPEETYDVEEEEGINIVQQPSTIINAYEIIASESEISPGPNIIVEKNNDQPSSGGEKTSIESDTILASKSEISPGANIVVEENNDHPSSGGENTSIESDSQPVKLDESEISPGANIIVEENNDQPNNGGENTSIESDTEPVKLDDSAVHVVLEEGKTKSSEQELDEKNTEENIPEISKDVESPIAAVVQSADSISAATTTETRSPPDQLAKVPSETAEQIQPPSEIAPPAPAPNTESNTSNSSVRENGQSGSSSPIGRTKPAVPAKRPQRRETERMTCEISVAQAVEPEKEIPPYMLARPLPESTAPMFMWRPNASLSEPPKRKKIVVKQVEEKPSFWARLTGKGSKKKGTEDKKTERRKSKRDTQSESDSRSELSSESDSEESSSADSEIEDSDASSGRKSHGGKEKHHSRGRSEKVQSGKKKEGADIARSKSDRGSSTKREEKGDKIVRKSRSARHKKDDRERRSRQSSEERERVDEREKNRSRNDERVERSKSDRGERKTKQEGHERRSKSARSRGDGKLRSHRSSDERESGEETTRTKPLKREPEGYQPLPRSETVLKDDGGKSTGAPPVTRTQTEKTPEKKPPAPPIVIVERPMLETLIPADLILEDQQVQVPDQNLQDPVLLIMTSCFPEEDASLLHSILEGHEFDLEKSVAACRSYGFTENASAIQTALAPRKPASIAIDISVKLMRLNVNFPELAKDILTVALFAHDGDVDKTEAYLLANGENMNFHKVAPSVIPLSPETGKGPVNNEEREAAHGNRNANHPAPWTEMQDDEGEEDLT